MSRPYYAAMDLFSFFLLHHENVPVCKNKTRLSLSLFLITSNPLNVVSRVLSVDAVQVKLKLFWPKITQGKRSSNKFNSLEIDKNPTQTLCSFCVFILWLFLLQILENVGPLTALKQL